jgi:outer membrane protein assembly factor BamA
MSFRVLFLILALASGVNAAIRFDGNHHFKEGSLRELCRRAENASVFVNAVIGDYVNEGYLEATIVVRPLERDTTFVIHEGKRFSVADLTINGVADTLAATLLSKYDPPRYLTRSFLNRLADDLVTVFAEAGYPFCTVTPRKLAVVDSQVILEYSLVEGPRSQIGQITFPGLSVTKPEILRRRLSLRSGGLFRESALVSSQTALSQLRFCRLVELPQVVYDSRASTVDVAFPMKDEKNIAFNGFIFLNPDNSLAGQADISLLNAFGGGEESRFLWSKQNSASKKLSLSFLFPYVFGYPFDMSGVLSQEDRDSSFVTTTATLASDYHFSDEWSVGGSLRWDKVTPEANQPGPSARLLSVGLSNRFERRDSVERTRRGIKIEQRFVSSYRRQFPLTGGVSSGYSTRLEGEVRLWRPLGRSLVWYQGGYVFQIQSDFSPIPTDQLTSIGGSETLRGFRENSFLARSGITIATELRWFALDNLMLHLFSDNGYIRTMSADRGLSGFGAGMAITTTAGAFRLDLSLGEQKEFGKLLVHLGFEGKL